MTAAGSLFFTPSLSASTSPASSDVLNWMIEFTLGLDTSLDATGWVCSGLELSVVTVLASDCGGSISTGRMVGRGGSVGSGGALSWTGRAGIGTSSFDTITRVCGSSLATVLGGAGRSGAAVAAGTGAGAGTGTEVGTELKDGARSTTAGFATSAGAGAASGGDADTVGFGKTAGIGEETGAETGAGAGAGGRGGGCGDSELLGLDKTSDDRSGGAGTFLDADAFLDDDMRGD